MNSRALVKVREQSWMERLLGARGARALLAAVGTTVLAFSVPASMLEQLSTSSGLSELLPFLAPPLGLRARIALAIVLALLAVAIVWAIWGRRPSIKESDDMKLARKISPEFSWGALMRLVRGEVDEAAGPGAEIVTLRRRDRHPDAPPRPPLSASRDLPQFDAPEVDEGEADDAPIAVELEKPLVPPPYILEQANPAELDPPPAPPRSPEPLSDEEIARTLSATRSVEQSVPMVRPAAPMAKESSWSALTRNLPLIENANIITLADRFERGVARREVVHHAEVAQQVLDSRMAFVQPDPSVRAALRSIRPVEVVASQGAPASGRAIPEVARVGEDVEAALSSALATLRKLTETCRR